MPQLSEIIAERLDRLDSVPLALADSVTKMQRNELRQLLALLDNLSVKGGAIEITAANIGYMNEISSAIERIFIGDDYIKAVSAYANEFTKQGALVQEMFKSSFGQVAFSETSSLILNGTKRQAVSLLMGDAFSANVLDPIATLIEDSIYSGSGMAALRDSLTEIVEGGGKLGIHERYIKQTAFDAFAVSDRAYTNTVAKDLDVQFYEYLGGIIKPGRTSGGSRPFCRERNGKYYHREEIKTWAGSDWAGKASGTNESTIFLLLGGYNCQHSLVPRSTRNVPRTVLLDAMQRGWWKPSEFERKALGL
jgi:hypothetical protein